MQVKIDEFIVNEGNPKKIDYAIIVVLDKGEYEQKLYLSVQKGFNVNDVVLLYGGGGHLETVLVHIIREQRGK